MPQDSKPLNPAARAIFGDSVNSGMSPEAAAIFGEQQPVPKMSPEAEAIFGSGSASKSAAIPQPAPAAPSSAPKDFARTGEPLKSVYDQRPAMEFKNEALREAGRQAHMTLARAVESAAALPSGRVAAAARVAKGAYGTTPESLGRYFSYWYNLPDANTIGRLSNRIVTGNGPQPWEAPPTEAPTLDEFRKLAEADPNFAPTFQRYVDAQRQSQKLASENDGDRAAWMRLDLEKQVRAKYGSLDQQTRDRFEANRGTFSKGVLTGRQSSANAPKPTSEEFIQQAVRDMEIPGVHRPALSDNEIAKAMWDELQSVEAGRQAQQPWYLKALGTGAGVGAQSVALAGAARAIAPMEEASAFARGAVHGGLMNAIGQVPAIASGAQQGPNPAGPIEAGLTFGPASMAGEAAGNVVGRVRQAEFHNLYGKAGEKLAGGAAATDAMDRAALAYLDATKKAVAGIQNWGTVGANEFILYVQDALTKQSGGKGADDPVYQRALQAVVATIVGGLGEVGKVPEKNITKQQAEHVLEQAHRLMDEWIQTGGPVAGRAAMEDFATDPTVTEPPPDRTDIPEGVMDRLTRPGAPANKPAGMVGKTTATEPIASPGISAKTQFQVTNLTPHDLPMGEGVAYRGFEDISDLNGKWKPRGRAAYTDPSHAVGEHGIIVKFNPGETVEGSQYRPGGGGYVVSAGGASRPQEIYVDVNYWNSPAYAQDTANKLAAMFPEAKVRLVRTNAEPWPLKLGITGKDLLDAVKPQPVRGTPLDRARELDLAIGERTSGGPTPFEKLRSVEERVKAKAEAERKAMQGGDERKLEYLHGGLGGLYMDMLDYGRPEPSVEERRANARQTKEELGNTIRKLFRDSLGRLVGDKVAALATNSVLGADIQPHLREWDQHSRDRVFESIQNLKRREGAVDKFVKALSGGDPAKAKLAHEFAFWTLAQGNLHPSGSGERQGIPEGVRERFEAMKASLKPERYQQLEKLMRDFSDSAMQAGEAMEKAGIFPTAIIERPDGSIRELRYTQATEPGERKVSYVEKIGREQKAATPGPVVLEPGERLVGGMEFMRQQGHYLTNLITFDNETGGVAGLKGWGRRFMQPVNMVKAKLGWRTKQAIADLSKRGLTSEEAVALGLQQSVRPTLDKVVREIQFTEKAERQNHLREQGMILRGDELATQLKDATKQRETLAKADQLDGEIAATREKVKGLEAQLRKAKTAETPDQKEIDRLSLENRLARSMIWMLKTEAKAVRNSVEFDGWTPMSGAEFGAFDSKRGDGETKWYVRSDMIDLAAGRSPVGNLARMYSALHRLFKLRVTGMGMPGRIVSDMATNAMHDANAGFDHLSKSGMAEWDTVVKQLFQTDMRKESKRAGIDDPLLDEFESATEQNGWDFAGPGDIERLDNNRMREAMTAMRQASSMMDWLASNSEVLEWGVQKTFDNIPVFGWSRRLYKALTDKASSYFIWRMARKYGAFGQGPMSPGEAAEIVDSVYNMKKLSGAAHASALIDTFARYSLKQGQSYALGQATQEPHFWLGPKPLGRLRTGLDRVINNAPGSPGAQAALVGRAGISLLLKYLGIVAPLWGIKWAQV